MAKVHVLQMSSHGHFRVLVHFLPPTTTNSGGMTWKAAALAAGVTGGEAYDTGDAAEILLVEAGDVVELNATLTVDPTKVSGQPLVDAVDAAADAEKAKWLAAQQAALDWYGYTQGTVS